MPVIGESPAEVPDQAEAAIELTQQQQTTLAGDVDPSETVLDFPAIKAGKKELMLGPDRRWQFFGFAP
jgi:hypothetical protein